MIEVVFTDLDKTLLRDDGTISEKNLLTLRKLGKKNISRVVVTGRSLESIGRVLEKDFPVDIVAFSSGAGILDWKSKKLLFFTHFPLEKSEEILATLQNMDVDFMIHLNIPENHKFYYKFGSVNNPDFKRRVELYKDFAYELNGEIEISQISQFIVIFPQSEYRKFIQVKEKFPAVKLIRTTSPLDHESIWLEIFPPTVSKGFAAQWICEYLKIDVANSLGIGNDYNDIDLLDFVNFPFVVANAPTELKEKYTVTKTNNEDGFAEAITKEL